MVTRISKKDIQYSDLMNHMNTAAINSLRTQFESQGLLISRSRQITKNEIVIRNEFISKEHAHQWMAQGDVFLNTDQLTMNGYTFLRSLS